MVTNVSPTDTKQQTMPLPVSGEHVVIVVHAPEAHVKVISVGGIPCVRLGPNTTVDVIPGVVAGISEEDLTKYTSS